MEAAWLHGSSSILCDLRCPVCLYVLLASFLHGLGPGPLLPAPSHCLVEAPRVPLMHEGLAVVPGSPPFPACRKHVGAGAAGPQGEASHKYASLSGLLPPLHPAAASGPKPATRPPAPVRRRATNGLRCLVALLNKATWETFLGIVDTCISQPSKIS